jgi:hypothetical protein
MVSTDEVLAANRPEHHVSHETGLVINRTTAASETRDESLFPPLSYGDAILHYNHLRIAPLVASTPCSDSLNTDRACIGLVTQFKVRSGSGPSPGATVGTCATRVCTEGVAAVFWLVASTPYQ